MLLSFLMFCLPIEIFCVYQVMRLDCTDLVACGVVMDASGGRRDLWMQ